MSRDKSSIVIQRSRDRVRDRVRDKVHLLFRSHVIHCVYIVLGIYMIECGNYY